MKSFVFAVMIASIASAALIIPQAEARQSTRSFSCSAVQDFVRDKGAVVLSTKNDSIFRRFVDSLHYCRPPKNSLVKFTVPTKSGTCKLQICDEWRPFN